MSHRFTRPLLAVLLLGVIISAALGQATQTTAPAATQPADVPATRYIRSKAGTDFWMERHAAYVELAKKGGIDLYFLGDSITNRWRQDGQQVWDGEFAGWKPANFGIGGDRTQHVLWRIQNGEFENVKPKVVVLMIGTNNSGDNSAEEIAAGVTAIVREIQKQSSTTKTLLLAIFPRSEKPQDPIREKLRQTNAHLAKLDNGSTIKYLDIGSKFLTADGALTKEVMPDGLHLSTKGYQIWADAIKPQLKEWLGAPAATIPSTAPAK